MVCGELVALLERAGLRVEATWGDFDSAPLGPDSPRLIAIARKPPGPETQPARKKPGRVTEIKNKRQRKAR